VGDGQAREPLGLRRDFLVGLRARGLEGVELVVSDDHAGLVATSDEVIPEAAWPRCYLHFVRNALDHLELSSKVRHSLSRLVKFAGIRGAGAYCANF
jgi:transposase-like protein